MATAANIIDDGQPLWIPSKAPGRNELPIRPIPSKKFGVFNRTRLVADASDLKGCDFLQQLWNDSADVGLAISSEKTGKTVRFVLENVLKNKSNPDEPEIIGWEFMSADREVPNVRVTIYND